MRFQRQLILLLIHQNRHGYHIHTIPYPHFLLRLHYFPTTLFHIFQCKNHKTQMRKLKPSFTTTQHTYKQQIQDNKYETHFKFYICFNQRLRHHCPNRRNDRHTPFRYLHQTRHRLLRHTTKNIRLQTRRRSTHTTIRLRRNQILRPII